jgi:hypothetical protein
LAAGFYWWRALPARLRAKTGKRELRFSTRSPISHIAVERARHLSAVADRMFKLVEKTLMSDSQGSPEPKEAYLSYRA